MTITQISGETNMDYSKLNEEKIAEVEKEIYGGAMPAHNKSVLRSKLEAEDKFEMRRERIEDQHYKWGEPREIINHEE